METILGLDIGTASIGFALVRYDADKRDGEILTTGVRIFPEALEGKSEEAKVPKNALRRTKRLMRRQIRRRKLRRKFIRELLHNSGLLPTDKPCVLEGEKGVKQACPYELRKRALSEKLSADELGKIFMHLSQRRGFPGSPKLSFEEQKTKTTDQKKDEKKTKKAIKSLEQEMGDSTLGTFLSDQDKKRGRYIHKEMVVDEFNDIWEVQKKYYPHILTDDFKKKLSKEIFYRRPVFWRWKTIGKCDLEPDSPLLMKAHWKAQQFIMLQTLNNLRLASGKERGLSEEERKIVYDLMMSKVKVTFGAIRKALKNHWKEHNVSLDTEFNFESGDDKRKDIPGNATEALLRKVLGDDYFSNHPCAKSMREDIAQKLWKIQYEDREIKKTVKVKGEKKNYISKRIEIRDDQGIKQAKQKFVIDTVREWGITEEKAKQLAGASLPAGWINFSEKVVSKLLPQMEAGEEMTEVLKQFYPPNERMKGENLPKLPSHHGALPDAKNPVVIRCLNEVRKVVNNLISVYGKPDRVRIELARDVKLTGKKKAKAIKANRENRAAREKAKKWLVTNDIPINKWNILKHVLWEESKHQCLYSGKSISADNLFRYGRFEIEHILPKPRSRDDSQGNLLLCDRELNKEKGNRTPYEAFGQTDEWNDMLRRINDKKLELPDKKIKNFEKQNYRSLDQERANSQLNDTAYATTLVRDFIARLYPKGEAIDWTKGTPRVQVLNGRITNLVASSWNMYRDFNKYFLGKGANKKNRDDHRHHTLDAITIAFTTPRLVDSIANSYNKELRKGGKYEEIKLNVKRPWDNFHKDIHDSLEKIIVSYRTDGKVNGKLTEDTHLSNKRKKEENGETYFAKRIDVDSKITPDQIRNICDPTVKRVVWQHLRKFDENNPKIIPENPDEKSEKKGEVSTHIKGIIKKAFHKDAPPLNMTCKKINSDGTYKAGPPIMRVRIWVKQQEHLTVKVSANAVALKGDNHHIALYQGDNKILVQSVSKLDALQRVQKEQPIVLPENNGAPLIFSFVKRDIFEKKDPETGEISYWRVAILGEKQVTLFPHTYAGTGSSLQKRPYHHNLIKEGYRKVSVDPIGRVRSAK